MAWGEDLKEALKRLKLGKSPSKDNITPEMIKHMGREEISKLGEIMNDPIDSQKIPQDYKTDIIPPTYKKWADIRKNNWRDNKK